MNNNFDATTMLCKNIAALRRAKGFTQEELAEKLGITFQAISKWENLLSCPDISLVPDIAKIFCVSTDALFGMEKEEKVPLLPWDDDGKLHIAVFEGTRPVSQTEYRDEKMKIAVELKGEVQDVTCDCCVISEHIGGNVCMVVKETKNTQLNIACENIEGDITISLQSSEKSPVSFACNDIEGEVTIKASGDLTFTCDDIDGEVTVSGAGECCVTCDNIDGDVTVTGGRFACSGIGGDLSVSGKSEPDVTCDNVDGDVTVTGGRLGCSVVSGNVNIAGKGKCSVDCDTIDGEIICR